MLFIKYKNIFLVKKRTKTVTIVTVLFFGRLLIITAKKMQYEEMDGYNITIGKYTITSTTRKICFGANY
jgi:hypothetical protein